MSEPQWVARTSEPQWRVVGNLRGPQGPPGEGASYTHVQTVPAAQWTVQHDLHTYSEPLILLDGEDAPVYTDFTYVDNNLLLVHFPEPVTGRAFVSN